MIHFKTSMSLHEAQRSCLSSQRAGASVRPSAKPLTPSRAARCSTTERPWQNIGPMEGPNQCVLRIFSP